MSITLPAVLASGNLPALCEWFDVELVIVAESRMFDPIRRSRVFLAAEKICSVRLVPLDDLMTDRSIDYGMMLTYALFRGFADLGARMTETYLLFLNADFILSDGSLRHLGKLMREGKRVIHSPSFRVILEQVWPQLRARVDAVTCTLTLPGREMARLALANRHRTVQARTVNQQLCYQSYMDQFYWYVDDNTLIGYQWPVALVAIKPERLITEPVIFWDFGFVPEAAPRAQPHFISDSDDFFMIEPQARNSGQEMIRFGGASIDEIAAVLSLYATKEHRECGNQLLKIHAGDLPGNLEEVIRESRSYMAELFRRLSPTPVPHIKHPRLGQWFEETKRRRRGPTGTSGAEDITLTATAPPSQARSLAASALFALQSIYRKLFGTPPHISRFHPLWVDTFPITRTIATWRGSGKQKILWISSVDSSLDGLLGPRINPTALLIPELNGSFCECAPYDACLCELSLAELLHLKPLYGKIRPLIREGGEIVVNVRGAKGVFDGAASVLEQTEYPSVDISEIHFYGTATTAVLRNLCMPGLRPLPTRAVARALIVSSLIFLAPFVWLANTRAARRNSLKFSTTWTSLLIKFTVRRGQAPVS